jgi:hypothetical protein
MSLANRLRINFKDFFPKGRGRLLTDQTGTVAYISEDLYRKIKEVAAEDRIPPSNVLHKLREELNEESADCDKDPSPKQ